MSDEQKLASFMQKHGEPEDVARHYLSTNNWTLEQASRKYESDRSMKQRSSVTIATNQGLQSLESLFSRHAQQPGHEPDAYYAGGSESSGQQILGQSSAKRVQIENSTPALTTVDSDRSLRAWGHGVRLGSAHPINPPPTRDARDAAADTDSELTEPEQTMVVLHLWSEGFSLDDGSLRLYEVPENERFLRAIMRGDYPDEMQQLGQRIELSIQDHTNISFRHLSRKQFMGPGRALGSPVPPTSTDNTPTTAAAAADAQLAITLPQQQQLLELHAERSLQLNVQAALTTIQFRLADGSRLAARFNHTHNIADLYRYVRLARPQYESSNFMVMSAFPRVELQESDTRSLAACNLLNVVLTQHIIEQSESQNSVNK
ncbi:NSFL1 cofactor p47 [Drosophila busckii]|uniref:NSFL1 cofactor p47 n=1 Tax=Drosophila busckii TaxID=30019 RepID=UPI00083F433A|nr:NSFL1 cofactor p47 [Drosophila busckii]